MKGAPSLLQSPFKLIYYMLLNLLRGPPLKDGNLE